MKIEIKSLSNFEKRKIVRKDYDFISQDYAKICEIKDYKEFLDEFLSLLKGKKILDVGCGSGLIANYFYGKGFDVRGLDFSKNLLKIARKNYSEIEFIECDICKWNSNEKFDGVFTKDMLFHLPDDDLILALKNIKKSLNKNGIFYIIMDCPKIAGEQILPESLDVNSSIYYNYLTPNKFESLLLDAGYKLEKIKLFNENIDDYIYADGVMVFVVSLQDEKN